MVCVSEGAGAYLPFVRIAILNQTFPPDVVASAQYVGDLAQELSALGHDVTVVASRRGYDDTSTRFPASAEWHGVKVLRVGGSGLGKTARWRRALDFGTFLLSCWFRLLRLGRFGVVVALTSPPLISFVGALFVRLRGGRLVLWVLDLNPDAAVAAGWLRRNSVPTRVLESCLSYSLRTAEQVVVLDRFMKARVERKLTGSRTMAESGSAV